MPHHQMHIMKGRKRSRGFQSTAVCSRSLLVSVVLLLLLPLLLPAAASPSSPDNRIRLRSLNPDHSTESESEPRHLARRSTSVQHVCKCTCFSTNSTLIPLYAPVDPSKPCLTCTRQFCIDQNLDICKDAKLGDSDGDTATGFEGDVWAKCFERDSYKDRSIITLYLLVIIGLIGFAALRGRIGGWYEEYSGLGPRGIYDRVASAPWRR